MYLPHRPTSMSMASSSSLMHTHNNAHASASLLTPCITEKVNNGPPPPPLLPTGPPPPPLTMRESYRALMTTTRENLQDSYRNTNNNNNTIMNGVDEDEGQETVWNVPLRVGGRKGRRFTFQSTVRQIERRKIADKLSREAEEREAQRLSESEAMQKVEQEFQMKRRSEKANIRQQLRLFSLEERQHQQQRTECDADYSPSSVSGVRERVNEGAEMNKDCRWICNVRKGCEKCNAMMITAMAGVANL